MKSKKYIIKKINKLIKKYPTAEVVYYLDTRIYYHYVYTDNDNVKNGLMDILWTYSKKNFEEDFIVLDGKDEISSEIKEINIEKLN